MPFFMGWFYGPRFTDFKQIPCRLGYNYQLPIQCIAQNINVTYMMERQSEVFVKLHRDSTNQ